MCFKYNKEIQTTNFSNRKSGPIAILTNSKNWSFVKLFKLTNSQIDQSWNMTKLTRDQFSPVKELINDQSWSMAKLKNDQLQNWPITNPDQWPILIKRKVDQLINRKFDQWPIFTTHKVDQWPILTPWLYFLAVFFHFIVI